MESEVNNAKQIMEAVETLRREVAALSERMTAFEKMLPGNSSSAPPFKVVPAPRLAEPRPVESFSVELIAALSAAIAAYLGVKPRIRQIRLLGSAPWVQQGRATIQASHTLAVQHG